MPHQVETMFSVRERPWHGLGKILQNAPDSEQALIAAGQAWSVAQYDLIVNGEAVPGMKANIRATDGQFLGIVSDGYRVLQNMAAFRWMDDLLGEGAVYETAGSLQNGRMVWMLARLPEEHRLAGDPTEVFLLVSNSHDGSSPIRPAIVPVRVVCYNTLNLALAKARRSWAIRHVGDIGEKMSEARYALGMVKTYMTGLSALADDLSTRRVEPEEWRAIVRKLMPTAELDTVRPQSIVRQQERQDALYERMLVDDLANHRWTAWGAINAVADFVDHATPQRETATFAENRFKSVTGGHMMVDRALEMLIG